jgi:FBP C-terminal treble-clef zinc-finger
MIPLTAEQIRDSFVNATKGDAKRAELPDLSTVRWESIDYLGWQDPRKPMLHYVVLEVDDGIVGMMLRGTGKPPARKMLCAWCEDIVDGIAAASFVAPLGGASGRRGNTIGTAVCADFRCSRNVRRAPAAFEVRTKDPEELALHRELRIAGLRERSTGFARAVMAG